MQAFYNHSFFENAVKQCGLTVNMCSILQYIVLHPLFNTKAFLIKWLKNFEEQVDGFFNVTGDSSVKKLGHPT